MKRYNHVVVIGVDGMGNFNQKASTPNIDKIFKNGATTNNALSLIPTISAQNWGGMLLGCEPIIHKLTNSIVGNRPYKNSAIPSLFSSIRNQYPEANLASFCNWNPINFGIIEDDCGVHKETADNDAELTDKIIDFIKNKPDFLFVQLDNVDSAGHRNGYGSQGHLDEISRSDEYIGRIYGEYKAQGMIDETLFIVISDHGGYVRSHGGYSVGERYVYLGVSGKNIKNGSIKHAYTKDISAIVLYALGVDAPDYNIDGYSSQVPQEIFCDYNGAYILPPIKEPNKKQFITKPYKNKNGFGSLFGDRVKLCMFFDNSFNDESGNCNFRQVNTFKFYNDGIVGPCGEGGANGWLNTTDLSVGKNSFSVAVWLETDLQLEDCAVVCTNKDWTDDRDDKGFGVILESHDIVFSLATGDDCIEPVIPFNNRTTDGWIHFIASLDREKCQIDFYLDFKHITSVKIPESFTTDFDNERFTVGNDKPNTYNNIENVITLRMDDLIVLDGALTEADVKTFENYYK